MARKQPKINLMNFKFLKVGAVKLNSTMVKMLTQDINEETKILILQVSLSPIKWIFLNIVIHEKWLQMVVWSCFFPLLYSYCAVECDLSGGFLWNQFFDFVNTLTVYFCDTVCLKSIMRSIKYVIDPFIIWNINVY